MSRSSVSTCSPTISTVLLSTISKLSIHLYMHTTYLSGQRVNGDFVSIEVRQLYVRIKESEQKRRSHTPLKSYNSKLLSAIAAKKNGSSKQEEISRITLKLSLLLALLEDWRWSSHTLAFTADSTAIYYLNSSHRQCRHFLGLEVIRL